MRRVAAAGTPPTLTTHHQAHSEYVQGHRQLRTPQQPKPAQDYVERYKARLRVDWGKWDQSRAARGPADAGPASPPSAAAGAASAAAGVPTVEATRQSRAEAAEVWQPDTLSKSRVAAASSGGGGGGGGGGPSATGGASASEIESAETVEIAHVCGDGRQIKIKVSCPVESSRPEASANSPSSFDTPRQRQIKPRPASRLGQPRPTSLCGRAGTQAIPALFPTSCPG